MNDGEFRRIRRQITLWYVGVFAAILVMFGGAVYLAVTHQSAVAIERQLVAATGEIERALQIRERERGLPAHAVDALDELRIPGIALHVLDADGRPVRGADPPPHILALGRRTLASGRIRATPEIPGDTTLRVYGRRVTIAGRSYAALASAPAGEVEERYPGLLASFLLAALGALVLVALGGAALARKSLVPVEESMQRMRRFVADASHELRSPAASLRTQAEVALQRTRTPAEYSALLERVLAESTRLGRLVDGLLLLAADDEDRLSAHRRPVFLDDLLVEASEMVAALAASRNVTLTLGTFDEAPIEGDPDLVRQLCFILLDNAVKYTPAEGTVRVDATADASTCRIRVRDTGPGVEPAVLAHVFERFYRADPARARTGGSGLGLAIARSIADVHGATIDLSSTPGSGTTVQVDFPRRPAPPSTGSA